MSFELQQKKENDMIKEMSKNGRCASCGKKWDDFDNFEEYISELINKGIFNTTARIRCLEVVVHAAREAW